MPGTPQNDEDVDAERPAKVQRCTLCCDYDDLLTDHRRVWDELESRKKDRIDAGHLRLAALR